ncbi:hypothetical protein ACJ2A9_01450 [Anaerobacillus sp. MEB173]|uniref:hypothetical protein n=1 Tax=Anaerobacillus sp. MEB173 TaxID=3383345 RepID=UPI003F92574F
MNSKSVTDPSKKDHFGHLGQKIFKSKSHGRKRSVITLSGIISHIGVNHIDLVRDNQTTIRVLTDRISKVKWIDRNCRNKCVDGVNLDCDCNERHTLTCSHCHHHFNDCRCRLKFNRIHDHVIPFCDDRIHLRLAGLTDSINFKLFRHQGCKVILELHELKNEGVLY